MQRPAILRNRSKFWAKPEIGWARLKILLTRNAGLKGVALVLAVFLWGYVALQRRGETTELKFSTPLVFRNIPPNIEVTHAPVQTVSVLVRTQRRTANSLNPNQFQVFVDLS
jgi:hypothetical protein